MKKLNIFSHAVMLAIAALPLLASCVSDDSSEGGITLPTLAVGGTSADSMALFSVNLGDSLILKPDVSYNGSGDLTYEWLVGTYANGVKGDLEKVSTDPTLHYFFPRGGSYYVHLRLTDGKVGTVADYQVNVNRSFERGFLLVSNDAAGHGNLVFIRELTDEEKAEGLTETITEHCLERMNAGIGSPRLVNALVGTLTWPSVISRLLVSTEDRCYFLDPNTFTIVTDINYGDTYAGFKADKFLTATYPMAYDSQMKKCVHLNLQYMFPFEYKYYVGMPFSDFITSHIYQWGSVADKVFYVDYQKPSVALFNSYASYYGYDTFFPASDTLLNHQELLTIFAGSGPGKNYITPSYVLSRDSVDRSLIRLWVNNTNQDVVDQGFTSCKTYTLTGDEAVPRQGTPFMLSRTSRRYYYALDNSVFVYNPLGSFVLPRLSQAAITFPKNETITFLDTDVAKNLLYIATYDSNTARGNFYVYSCADVATGTAASAEPLKAYKGCADRITSVIYKPSIQ